MSRDFLLLRPHHKFYIIYETENFWFEPAHYDSVQNWLVQKWIPILFWSKTFRVRSEKDDVEGFVEPQKIQFTMRRRGGTRKNLILFF